MPATTTLQVLQGIQTRLETISGLRVYDVIEGSLNPPCALITVDVEDYHATFGGDGALKELSVVIHCMAGRGDRAAQLQVYGWVDPASSTSVRKAIEDAPTLGGVACSSQVVSARTGFFDENGLTYFGARFEGHVLIR